MVDKKQLFSIQNMVLMAVCVALMAVCSWISFPIGVVSITLQTFGVFVTAGLLGLEMGTITIFVYILLGIIGVPVFSGFASGIACFTPYSETGATGGYIIGFIFSAIVIGLFNILIKKVKSEGLKIVLLMVGMLLGDVACFVAGTVWFVYFNPWEMGLNAALAACVTPFIIPDLVKIIIASIVVNRVKKYTKIFDFRG